MSYILEYLAGVKLLVDEVDAGKVEKLADLLVDAWTYDRRVLLLGNGGSAATA